MTFSKISLILCAVLLVYSGSFFYPRWQKSGDEALLSWDAGGYYWYLPSAFIYKDLKTQKFKDNVLTKYQLTSAGDFQYAFIHDQSGNYVIRYTMGTAILEAPYFFIAHWIAKPLGYPNDGFSLPYQFMIYIGGIFFALLGLWYLRKVLLFYYHDNVVAILLFLLVFGTNYLNYAGIDIGMTHTWLFTIYVFILLNTHYYYLSFEKKYILRLGALIGLIGLVRPPEIIAVLIPLLWGLNNISIKNLKQRILLFKSQWKSLLASAFICSAILSLQFFYWKYATGQWFVYTYQDQGFSWLSPHFKQYALNYQCGWLWYTPIMFLALAGIIVFVRSGKNRVAIISMIIINYYIVAGWNAWDYGGRAMIQNYPLLLFPLGSLLNFLSKKRMWAVLATPVFLICVYFNLWWTYQAHKGSLIGSAPGTRSYYWATALRFNLPLEIQKLRDNEDLYQKKIKTPVILYFNDLNTDTKEGHFTIVNDRQESLNFTTTGKKYIWIRASADIHIDQKEWNVWFMTQFIIRLKKGKDVLQENSIRVQRFLDDKTTKNITVDAKVKYDTYDNIEILFRNDNNGSMPCIIDNIKVISFDQ
jgi:hypothetical protein